jgi:hypothetical protein
VDRLLPLPAAWDDEMRRRNFHVKELNMENIWGPNRGEFVRAEESTSFDGPDGPARTGRARERPARLEEGDMVEAVSRAVLSQLEGGAVFQTVIRIGIWPVDPLER